MDYARIINSSYSWVSIRKVAWFVTFFWICLPVLIFLPNVLSSNSLYMGFAKDVAFVLYDILYLVFILGIIVLIQHCLVGKREHSGELSFARLGGLVLLVFVELFYAFVWSLNASLRLVQLLLLVIMGLSLFFFLSVPTYFSLVVYALCLFLYILFVIHNIVRLFFSSTIYFNSSSILVKDAVKESWALTHDHFSQAIRGIYLSGAVGLLLFLFVWIALGSVSSLFLRFFFIDSIAVSKGFLFAAALALCPAILAYHFAIAELFSQLKSHRESSQSIKRILAHRILNSKNSSSKVSHKQIVPRRPLMKKKKGRK